MTQAAHPLAVLLFSLRLSVVLLLVVALLTAAPAAGRGATGSGSEGGASDALVRALELSDKGAHQNGGLDSISDTVAEVINEVRQQMGGTVTPQLEVADTSTTSTRSISSTTVTGSTSTGTAPQDISSTTGSTSTAATAGTAKVEVRVPCSAAHKLFDFAAQQVDILKFSDPRHHHDKVHPITSINAPLCA